MDVHYTVKNKEKETVWFIKEDLEVLKKGKGEKWKEKRTSMGSGWIFFRRWVTYRDRWLALFSAERTTGLWNDCTNKIAF